MKRIVFAVLVLMLAAPALADVDIWCECDVNEVTVYYDAITEPNLIRAFALDVNVSNGNIVDVDDEVNPDYWVFPGSWDMEPYTAVGNPAQGPPGGTGPGLDSNWVTIEMGSLYADDDEEHPDPPDPCDVLFKFYVDSSCTVTIAENSIRGGVVSERIVVVPAYQPIVNFSTCEVSLIELCTVPNVVGMNEVDASAAIVDAGLSVGVVACTNDCTAEFDFEVVIQAPVNGGNQVECGSAVDITICECYCDQPDYAQWVAVGKPICWCWPYQCFGDADGSEEGKYGTRIGGYDNAILKDAWLKKTGELTGNDACADFDHSEEGKYGTRIGGYDNEILKDYWLDKTTDIDPNRCPPGNREP